MAFIAVADRTQMGFFQPFVAVAPVALAAAAGVGVDGGCCCLDVCCRFGRCCCRRQMQMGLRLREDVVVGVVDGVSSLLLLLLSLVRAAMITQSSSVAAAAGRDGLFPCADVGDANGSPIDPAVVRYYFCSKDAAPGLSWVDTDEVVQPDGTEWTNQADEWTPMQIPDDDAGVANVWMYAARGQVSDNERRTLLERTGRMGVDGLMPTTLLQRREQELMASGTVVIAATSAATAGGLLLQKRDRVADGILDD
ncbi:hypothetical protein ACLOJK_000197 [Asimina triloba]